MDVSFLDHSFSLTLPNVAAGTRLRCSTAYLFGNPYTRRVSSSGIVNWVNYGWSNDSSLIGSFLLEQIPLAYTAFCSGGQANPTSAVWEDPLVNGDLSGYWTDRMQININGPCNWTDPDNEPELEVFCSCTRFYGWEYLQVAGQPTTFFTTQISRSLINFSIKVPIRGRPTTSITGGVSPIPGDTYCSNYEAPLLSPSDFSMTLTGLS
jgi:hypothetical protein